MFNKLPFKMQKSFYVFLIICCCFSCKEEVTLNFSEINIVDEDETTVEINIPNAEGKTEAAKQINTSLSHFVNTALNIEAVSETKTSTKESIASFKKAYAEFKTQIGKTLFTELPKWEVLIDGELIYKNKDIASIAMNSSINTGGAHSNLVFQFFNFDIKTGKQLQTQDLVNDIPAFTALAKKYYEKELLSAEEDRINAFKSNSFKLPKNLGFNDDGVIVFYDTFITGNNNIIEFTIPYIAANQYLSF